MSRLNSFLGSVERGYGKIRTSAAVVMAGLALSGFVWAGKTIGDELQHIDRSFTAAGDRFAGIEPASSNTETKDTFFSDWGNTGGTIALTIGGLMFGAGALSRRLGRRELDRIRAIEDSALRYDGAPESAPVSRTYSPARAAAFAALAHVRASERLAALEDNTAELGPLPVHGRHGSDEIAAATDHIPVHGQLAVAEA